MPHLQIPNVTRLLVLANVCYEFMHTYIFRKSGTYNIFVHVQFFVVRKERKFLKVQKSTFSETYRICQEIRLQTEEKCIKAGEFHFSINSTKEIAVF